MASRKRSLPPSLAARVQAAKSGRLDLGCGRSKTEGFFGVDQFDLPGVDLVHNLEEFPWPLPDNYARAVVISHFWEHVKPWLTLRFMAELHRVCQDEAHVMIAGPYGVEFRFVQDPTHCNPTNEATFQYWDNSHPLWHVYRPPVFHVEHWELMPVGGMGRDFNAVLRVCKQAKGDQCPHRTAY